MAKVRKNPVVQGISGSVGNLVFRQAPGGETWVSGTPDFSHREFSQSQQEHQQRFREAAAYAREAAKTQPIYARLAAGTVKSAYNWAVADWFNPPVIRRIERQAGRVRVEASDNVLVARVRVTILGADGERLEQGAATQADGDWWEYAPAQAGRALAEAWDLAGNKVSETERPPSF